MVVTDVSYEKSVFLKYFNGYDNKGCLLDKHFCCHGKGRCGFFSAGSLEKFIANMIMCERKYGL